MRPLVSVIIPTYNRAGLLRRALASVAAQTYPLSSIETIVVDDGSTDDTQDVIAREFPGVRYLYQANAGVSAARNRGLGEASGSILAFLDSDDLWLPEKLAAQIDKFAAHRELGMVVTDVLRRNVNGAEDTLRRRDTIPTDGFSLHTIAQHPALVPSSVAMRRDVYEVLGGFDLALRTAEDIDYMLRVARLYPIGVIEEPLTIAARGLEDGLNAVAGTYKDYLFVMERFFNEYRDELPAAVRHTALARARARFARGLAGGGEVRNAAEHWAWSVYHTRRPRDVAHALRAGAAVAKAAVRKAIPKRTP